MFRNYHNKTIAKNVKNAHVLSVISLYISMITVTVFACLRHILYKQTGVDEYEIAFYIFCIFVPLVVLYITKAMCVQQYGPESRSSNDFSVLVNVVVVTFIPYILLIFFGFLCLCFGSLDCGSWAYMCGYMLPAHILLYIGDILLIYSCVLIKREWKEIPPEFVNTQRCEKENAQVDRAAAKREKRYSSLIEKCGVRFFIKYYDQIKRMLLRDVVIEENYHYAERDERLNAAKRIVDLGLTEFACGEISRTYGDILTEDEKDRLNAISSEFESKDDAKDDAKPQAEICTPTDDDSKLVANTEPEAALSEDVGEEVDKVNQPAPAENKWVDASCEEEIDGDYRDEWDDKIYDVRNLVIKYGTCPERIGAPLGINIGQTRILVYDKDICVGAVWEHCERRESDANGQAEIRFFDSCRKEYGQWHRMFALGRRLPYADLAAYLSFHCEYAYTCRLRGH